MLPDLFSPQVKGQQAEILYDPEESSDTFKRVSESEASCCEEKSV